MNAQTNSLGQPIGVPLRMVFPRPRPPATPLHGRFCSVVPTDVASHAGDLFDAFSADTLGGNWTYLPYGPFDTLAAMQSWMQTTCTGSDPLFHTILDSKGHPQGLTSYLRIEPATGVIEVGHIHLANAVQRTPAATEAMFLMMNRVFDELGYRRYEWKCDALNEPSRRAWFSVIGDEWPALRAAFEQWLSPANVDAQGRQLRRIDELRNHASSTG